MKGQGRPWLPLAPPLLIITLLNWNETSVQCIVSAYLSASETLSCMLSQSIVKDSNSGTVAVAKRIVPPRVS